MLPVIMVRRKTDDVVEGIVMGLLKQNMSYRKIVKTVKEMGYSISVASIHQIKHCKGVSRNLPLKPGEKRTIPKRCTAATPDVIRKIDRMIKRVNPPSQPEMANSCGVSLGTVNRIINCLLKAKLRKKRPVHKLSDAQIKKRRAPAWRLYLRLNNNKWKNFVTTDEAMFYMGGSYGRRRVCYIRSNETDMQKLKFVKRDSFAPGFMVWAGVSYYGKTSLRIINKGVKVNADYYIGHVLKPFIEKDVPRLFPGCAREMVFHQDSASSHTARKTLDFLQKRRVQNITPSEWMPKSPDCAPMDYGIWGILKRCLQKRSIYTGHIMDLKELSRSSGTNLSSRTSTRHLRAGLSVAGWCTTATAPKSSICCSVNIVNKISGDLQKCYVIS